MPSLLSFACSATSYLATSLRSKALVSLALLSSGALLVVASKARRAQRSSSKDLGTEAAAPQSHAAPIPPRIVLITGCDTGFGALLVRKAMNAGFTVIAACYTPEGAAQYDQDAAGSAVVADLLRKEGRQAVVQATKEACCRHVVGLYAVVHNAGLVVPGGVDWLPPSAYEASMDLMFHAPVELTYELLPLLRQSRGRIVCVTSVDGLVSLPMNAPYCAAKHALEAWCDVVRCELMPWQMKVVVLQPSTMRTPLALGFADALLRTYREAPPDRQSLYGERWIVKQHAATRKTVEDAAMDPDITATDLLRALTDPNPPPRILSGTLARVIFYPLSLLPDALRDRVLYHLCLRPSHHRVQSLALPLPRSNSVAYLRLRVSNLGESVAFYSKLGFAAVGDPHRNQQWMRSGGRGAPEKLQAASQLDEGPLLLLAQDSREPPSPSPSAQRPHWTEVGSTRLSLYTPHIDAAVERLRSVGLEPIHPVASDPRMGRVAVYTDPDGTVVYFVELVGIPRWFLRASTWWRRLRDPVLFHATLNVPSAERAASQLEAVGFASPFGMQRHEVSQKLLEGFDPPVHPNATVARIDFWRPKRDPQSIFLLDVMEWDRPTTASESVSNPPLPPALPHHSVAVAVDCVEAALAAAKAAGWTVESAAADDDDDDDGRFDGNNNAGGGGRGASSEVRLIDLPVYGPTRVGSASLQGDGTNRFDFVQFHFP